MKRVSIKLKLSMWFTLILTVICVIMLLLMLGIYHRTDRELLMQTLTSTVDKTASKLRTDRRFQKDVMDGRLDDGDFYEEDVQIMILDEHGRHIAGLFLYEELDEKTLAGTGKAVRVELDGKGFYCCDKRVHVIHSDDLYVRGLIAAEDDLPGSLMSHSRILIAMPLLLALAFGGGYLITGRLLRPVRSIRKTAEEIRVSGDLAKRIETNGSGDELDELSQTINAMFDKLENDFDAQKQFTSNASHELRTPVSVILAQCEYGFDHADNAEELLEVITSVQEQGYRMSGLIRSLLMFTRIEQGTERYPKAETDLSELVRSVCADMRIIADKNITVSEELAPVTACVNREMFTLLTVNLIQNAVRYGKENGSVRVKLSGDDETAVLSVEDDGIGIAAEDLPHIWERFYRSDRSRSSKGLGLGLALVKQIAGFHGGTAEAESREGVGSRFTVTIRKN